MSVPTASTSSAGDLELPRPLRLVLTAAWSLLESIGLPAAAYLAAAGLDGRDAGLIAGLAAIWLMQSSARLRPDPSLACW